MISDKKVLIKFFEKAGIVGPQPKIIKMIRLKFNTMSWEDFHKLFMEALLSVIVAERPINCTVVGNMIKFAAHTMSDLTEHNTKDGRSGMYLLTDFIRICFRRIHSSNKTIRWRFCLFLNHMLNFMSSGTVLSVELCDVATTILLDRLKDKKSDIRVQAIHALHRLQLPDNHRCKIVKQFMFHMTSDPCVDVRATITKEIAMFNIVVDEMLKYTISDISETVRKETYNRFLEYPFSHLSYKQRQTIVEIGLKDSSKHIRSLVKDKLLVKWLDMCNNDFEILLKSMNVENVSVCEQIVVTLFEALYDTQVFDLINKYLDSKTRLIDFDQLTIEKIFLWKCTGKYLTFEKKIILVNSEESADNDYIEILLPDLVKFSDYIREYYFSYDVNNEKEFILVQLLDLASIFVMDDVGATSLNKLCCDLILDNKTSVKIIPPLTALLNLTFKNGSDILNYTKQILNEIQIRTVDILPSINKVGTKKILENQIKVKETQIKDILLIDSDSEELRMLIIKVKNMIKEYNDISILTDDEITQVEVGVNILLKSFELVFQIQQSINVCKKRSLVADIIQNFIVDYLDCPMVTIRMNAIRSLSPYLLLNNLDAAKVHIFTLFNEISSPMTNKHLLFQLLFELLLTYGLKTFDINGDMDTKQNYGDDFTVENILPLLADSIDYEVDDNSFKSVIIEGFCNLLVFKRIESINLISKFLILWFRRLTNETFNIYHTLMKYFTTYMFHINSSSSTIAKCYVPVLKQLAENKLTDKLIIDLNEMNMTLINLSQGIIFRDEKMAINAHCELAGYILDYLLEDQPYTTMLVDTLHKLKIDFEYDNEWLNMLTPKVKRVIKHFKQKKPSNSNRYLKKIKQKFGSILQKPSFETVDNDVNTIEVVNEQLQSTSLQNCTQETTTTINHGDLFAQEHIENISLSSDEELDERCKNLSSMKRISEVFRKSFNMKNMNQSSSDSE